MKLREHLDAGALKNNLIFTIFLTFQGKGHIILAHGKWTKAIIQHHTSHLMSSPQCEDLLSSMHSMIEARTKNYSRILRLRGKLDIMTHQITSQPDEPEESTETTKEALLVYQDDDSSDDLNEHLDDMLMPASDTDNDDWNAEQDDVDNDSESEEEEDGDNVVEVESSDEGEPMANGVNESSDDIEEMDED